MTKKSYNLAGILALVLIGFASAQDWQSYCPEACQCTWNSNKKVAECRSAGFTTIPSQLSNEINVLDMTENSLTSLGTRAFKSIKLINLHKLILANNRIASIDKTAFEGLKLVFDLDLSNNQITWLHTQTFSGMEKMRKLILNGNPIERLEAYQFPSLTNLKHLEVDDCRLAYINNLAFNYLPALTSVSLKGNNLTVLQPELFMNLLDLRSVQLEDNAWHCDCRLRKLVSWNQQQNMGEAELACQSPQRVAGKRWKKLDSNDLACAPIIRLPKSEHSMFLGGNVTMDCGATGEPLPTIEWTLDGRVLSNYSRIPPKDPKMVFFVADSFLHGTQWLNLTVNHLASQQTDFPPSLVFKCVVVNPAKLVERNVTLHLQPRHAAVIGMGGASDIYLIIAIVAVLLLFVVVSCLCVYCCWRRKKHSSAKAKNTDNCLVQRNNILIVNPMELSADKSDKYEKVPQAELELTDLSQGSHTNFEEMNYPEERNGRVRSPLTVSEEVEFDHSDQKLLDLSSTTSTTLDLPPSYPDLLDNVRFPRAISPTQLSYHSLRNPTYTPSPEWRYSYVHPNEYNSLKHPSSYKSPVAQAHPRPGYVTLPRRPRATPSPLTSPKGHLPKLNAIYDTLGPRTTADGTSRTDLTRVMARNPMDALSPPVSPSSSCLPRHYVPTIEEMNESPPHVLTPPRPTPNFLNDSRGNSCVPSASPSPLPLSDSYEMPENANLVYGTLSQRKKQPPKPPPKPSNKRLSIASSVSDTNSRRSIIEGDTTFQDEGSDGTEV